MSAAAEAGMNEISRLSQVRDHMERHLRGRRSSSNLPATIELILSRPIVSARMIAKTARATQRGGALNLVSELNVREVTLGGAATGRGAFFEI